jgi:ABC-type multidrug transport system fused ATPase/permease subunit
MATVVTVHGTFAHSAGTADALGLNENADPQWWQAGSSFESHTRALVHGADGKFEFVPFSWSSINSERARRNAGSSLLALLRRLEARQESYCLIGHSHGGSVIASALVESVARGAPLNGMKKWISVGTPFIELKKEHFLFSRLSLTRQVLFVASLMLLMMFLFYVVGEILSGAGRVSSEYYWIRLLFSGAMMSIPFVVLYFVFKYLDRRELFSHGRRIIRRAHELYAPKWLSLCHEDDEAVQGLRYLPSVKLHFFEKDFAVSTLTMAAIFFLPIAYLLIVTSPTIMVGIADFLKNKVYAVDQYQGAEAPIAAARDEMRRLSRSMRDAREEAEKSGLQPSQAEDSRRKAEQLRTTLREKRQKFETSYPEFAEAERALRFKRRFLEKDGKPCDGGTLCGTGHDYALNSKLLFHVVTDELASAVVNDEIGWGAFGGTLRLLVPIVLVPVVFALIALAFLAVIRLAAVRISAWLSGRLNAMTLSEIRRSAFGNDTEGEIAFAADHRPGWITPGYSNLPAEVGDKITECSNHATFQSLAKFRNAISTLAFAEGGDKKTEMVSSYLSWKELIHTCYFDVPEFRKLIARAISSAEGFSPTDRFQADPDYETTLRWLKELEPKPSP